MRIIFTNNDFRTLVRIQTALLQNNETIRKNHGCGLHSNPRPKRRTEKAERKKRNYSLHKTQFSQWLRLRSLTSSLLDLEEPTDWLIAVIENYDVAQEGRSELSTIVRWNTTTHCIICIIANRSLYNEACTSAAVYVADRSTSFAPPPTTTLSLNEIMLMISLYDG